MLLCLLGFEVIGPAVLIAVRTYSVNALWRRWGVL